MVHCTPPLPSLALYVRSCKVPTHPSHYMRTKLNKDPSRLQALAPPLYLNSMSMLLSGARPTQARMMFSSMARCLASALTTGVP